MRQIFIAALALAIFVTFLIFTKVQTLYMLPYNVSLSEYRSLPGDSINPIEQQKDVNINKHENISTNEQLLSPPTPDTIYEQLKDAAIAYNAPSSAFVDNPINVTLRIDPTATVEQLKKMMPNVSGDIIVKEIQISQIIRAELTVNDTEFRLVNLSPNEQALFATQPNVWIWQLTPLTAGKNYITISVTALVHVLGHDTNHFITAYSDNIVVSATTEQQINALYDKHKDKLWGILVVPAFELARRLFNKWREEKGL